MRKLTEQLLRANLPEVLASLAADVVGGSVTHQRLFFELVGMKELQGEATVGIKVLVGVDLDRV